MGFNNIFTRGFTQITACKQLADKENHPNYLMEVETCSGA